MANSGPKVSPVEPKNLGDPTPSSPVPLRLIPEKVYEYAQARRDGTLPDTIWPSGSPANDEKLWPYLDAAAKGDEDRTIGTLAWQVLAPWPTRIHRPSAPGRQPVTPANPSSCFDFRWLRGW